MKKNELILIAVLIIIFGFIIVFGLKHKSEYNSNTEKYEKEVETLEKKCNEIVAKSFDLATENLSYNLLGDDIKTIYSCWIKRIPGKDEFETTKQYSERLKSVIPENIVYAFIATPFITYNADTQLLDIIIEGSTCRGRRAYDLYEGGVRTIPLITEESNLGTYEASNAFGAKRMVEKYSVSIYGIGVKSNKFKDGATLSDIKIGIKMAPEKAKMLSKDAIKILFIGSPAIFDRSIFIQSNKGPFRPTLANPIDIDCTFKGINIELKELWIFNFATGEILKKLKL